MPLDGQRFAACASRRSAEDTERNARLPEPVEHENYSSAARPVRQLGFFDCSMIVMGAMIGSGLFIVRAGMARTLQSPGWFLVAWMLTGALTVCAAISYGELSSALPEA